MTVFEILSVTLSFSGIILIPFLYVAFRGLVKWTRVEDRLDSVIKDLDELVRDKDRIHHELAAQMRDDRAAADRRLSWLEHNLWDRPGS